MGRDNYVYERESERTNEERDKDAVKRLEKAKGEDRPTVSDTRRQEKERKKRENKGKHTGEIKMSC